MAVPTDPLTHKPGRPAHRGTARKDLLRALLLLPLAAPFVAMLQRLRVRERPAPLALPAELPLGLSLQGDALVHRHADGRVQAWSARCTHLGCRLDRIIDGVVVCPCHGSRFDDQGRVLAGPAARPLVALAVHADGQGGWSAQPPA